MNRSTTAKKGSLETIDDQSYLGIDTNDRLTITRKEGVWNDRSTIVQWDSLLRSFNDRKMASLRTIAQRSYIANVGNDRWTIFRRNDWNDRSTIIKRDRWKRRSIILIRDRWKRSLDGRKKGFVTNVHSTMVTTDCWNRSFNKRTKPS